MSERPSSLRRYRDLVRAAERVLAVPEQDPMEPEARGIQSVRRLLARAGAPQPPARLRDAAFFEEILERAGSRSARAIGPRLLRAAFSPARAGRDVAWIESRESPLAARTLRRPSLRTPGWLWLRLRDEIRAARAPARAWGLWAAAAAALVIAGVLAFAEGTRPPAGLVFEQVDRPLTTVGHPSDFLRDLGR